MYRILLYAIVCSAVLPGSAHAALVSISTHTDSNGYFRHTLHGGGEPYRWGGAVNILSVRLPARGVLGIVDTPGWVWSTNEPNAILWQYTGSNALVLDDGSIAFAYTSMYHAVTWYDDLAPTGEYCRALVAGEVYGTNHVLYTSSCAETGCVVSVNVAGYERVAFEGPMVPEPGGVWGLVGIGFTIYELGFTIWRKRGAQ